jgi:hypothetical protein
MRLEGVSGIEVLALPLGYSCALIVHGFVLIILARKDLYIQSKKLIAPFVQSFASAVFAGYVAYILLNYFVLVFTVDTLATVLAQGFLAAVGGGVGYVMLQYLFKNQELIEISRTLHKRFLRKDVVIPQDEDTLSV